MHFKHTNENNSIVVSLRQLNQEEASSQPPPQGEALKSQPFLLPPLVGRVGVGLIRITVFNEGKDISDGR